MKPVCAKCSCFMKVDKIGIDFIETRDDKATPYRLWSTDRFKCPRCGAAILINPSTNACSYDYDPNFQQLVDAAMMREGTVTEE